MYAKRLDLKYLVACGACAIVIGVLGWVLYDATVQSSESTGSISHTLEVIRAIDGVNQELGRAETAHRGFLFSGAGSSLSERDRALAEVGDTSIRIRKLTLETERTFIFRNRGGSRSGWCDRCEAEVELMTVADAAYETGLSELVIYQRIKSGDLHFTEDADLRIVACLSSLRCIRRTLGKKRATNEQNLEGGIHESED